MPRSAAIAGIAFSVLLTASLVLIRLAIPSDPGDPGAWISDSGRARAVGIGLGLVPFAGIAFLWFIGVLRERFGALEDRFFATAFLGSGLLFVAMLFAAAATAGALVDGASEPVDAEVWAFGRRSASKVLYVYAIKMAGVFMISTTTMGVRTATLPRWLVWVGYGSALVLLLSIAYLAWVALLFPVWVLVVSVHLLRANLRAR